MKLKQFYRYVFVFLLSVFVFTGCGSDNGGGAFLATSQELNKGKFIDSPVEGLSYRAGDITGKTDKDGFFNYNVLGEDIYFYIGSLNIGVAKASENVHINDLESSFGDFSINKNQRIAQILLSLDTDKNPDNNIQLPNNIDKIFDKNSTFSLTVFSQDDFDRNLKNKLKEWNMACLLST